jgi:hypothetical protein
MSGATVRLDGRHTGARPGAVGCDRLFRPGDDRSAFGATCRDWQADLFFLAAGYLDGNFTPGFGASTCGLRKVELTGATFLSAFGFLASRLPRCLLPLPMIVHPTVVLPPTSH